MHPLDYSVKRRKPLPTMVAFAFGEKVDDNTRNYYINNHEAEAGDYDRCNVGEFKLICLLTPHDGDIHKVLDHYGQIRTRQVRVRPKRSVGVAA